MPNSLRRLFNKLRFFARREKFDADLAEEMAYHRELKQRDIQSADPALTAKDAHHATTSPLILCFFRPPKGSLCEDCGGVCVGRQLGTGGCFDS